MWPEPVWRGAAWPEVPHSDPRAPRAIGAKCGSREELPDGPRAIGAKRGSRGELPDGPRASHHGGKRPGAPPPDHAGGPHPLLRGPSPSTPEAGSPTDPAPSSPGEPPEANPPGTRRVRRDPLPPAVPLIQDPQDLGPHLPVGALLHDGAHERQAIPEDREHVEPGHRVHEVQGHVPGSPPARAR
jgi:hypothetical protein